MASFNSTSDPGACYLSVHGRAISTILTSGFGSIVVTVVHGPAVAFFVGWHCYFGVIRVCIVSVASLFVNIFGPSLGIRQPFIAVAPTSKHPTPKAARHHPHHPQKPHHPQHPQKPHHLIHPHQIPRPVTVNTTTGGSNNADGGDGVLDQVGIHMPAAFNIQLHRRSPRVAPANIDESRDTGESQDTAGFMDVGTDEAASGGNAREDTSLRAGLSRGFKINKKEKNQSVSFLGGLFLVYSLVYTPMSQALWLIANWSLAPPLLFAARAISVTVIAMPYTIDTQARYGLAIGKMFGSKKVVPRLVNLYMAIANAVLSGILVVLCIKGLLVTSSSVVNSPGFYAVAFFSLISPLKSLVKKWPRDAGQFGLSLNIKAFCACECDLRKALRGSIVVLSMSFLALITAGPPVGILSSSSFAGWLQDSDRLTNSQISEADVKSLLSWYHSCPDSWWKKIVQIVP